MRVVKELTVEDIRISVFSWNNKYLIKYEQGLIEQTFKVNELEISGEEDLSLFFTGKFIKYVQKNFDEMHEMLKNQINNL